MAKQFRLGLVHSSELPVTRPPSRFACLSGSPAGPRGSARAAACTARRVEGPRAQPPAHRFHRPLPTRSGRIAI